MSSADWLPYILIISWPIGAWIIYMIVVGVMARKLKKKDGWKADDPIRWAKDEFWDEHSMWPLLMFFWPLFLPLFLIYWAGYAIIKGIFKLTDAVIGAIA